MFFSVFIRTVKFCTLQVCCAHKDDDDDDGINNNNNNNNNNMNNAYTTNILYKTELYVIIT